MNSIRSLLTSSLLLLSSSTYAQNSDSVLLARFFSTALSANKGYADLHDICKQCGHRLSGSEGAQKAVELTKKQMAAAGADTTWLQECMVPHWVRGAKEEGKIISNALNMNDPVALCALGGSIATPANGITAEVVEVKGLEQLKKMNASDLKGKIVLYKHCLSLFYVLSYGK